MVGVDKIDGEGECAPWMTVAVMTRSLMAPGLHRKIQVQGNQVH